jgi:hypothetical protein
MQICARTVTPFVAAWKSQSSPAKARAEISSQAMERKRPQLSRNAVDFFPSLARKGAKKVDTRAAVEIHPQAMGLSTFTTRRLVSPNENRYRLETSPRRFDEKISDAQPSARCCGVFALGRFDIRLSIRDVLPTVFLVTVLD